MSESRLYGTSKTSFQDVGNAKIIVKHNEAVDFENPAGRTQRIHSIYVESPEGERYKYPFKHLNGARAMAQHVSEGGNQYDAFGKHIVSLSEELSKLRTFKTYMNRSSVMAEGLAGYMDIVNERIDSVKETVHKLQRNSYYKEAMANFQETVMEEVPEDVSSNWIDELTIRQFNEDLKGVFPYIYNLVKEGTKSEALTPENLLGEDDDPMDPEVSDEMGDKINAWIEKYSKYEGGYGTMPKGYVKWALDSGIATDFIEENEDEAMEAKYGDAYLNDPWDLKFYNQMPITKACMEELEKITGNDDSDHNARIIDKVMNGDADESADVEEGAVKKALEDDAENLSREEFIEKHGDAEFFDNYNGVEDESMDMHGDFASHLDDVVANSKHEQGPNEVSSMGMNKYGLAAKHKDGKFISYKDGKETGTFDSIEELEKHQKELIQDESTTFEGNAFAQAVQKAKAAGMKKGDKFKTPDGEEHTLEDAIKMAGLKVEDFWTADELMAEKEPTDDDTMDVKIGPDGSISKADGDAEERGEKKELDLDEFIKGHFDYTTNNFPKGETAVLTACEKKYGDESLAPAAVIMKKLVTNQDGEMERIKHLAGLDN
jgi:hypothetical protein